MAHANILNNEMLNDDGIPAPDLPFADRIASKFRDQIRQFAAQRDQIPNGWHGIFDKALLSLKAVDCPNRVTNRYQNRPLVSDSNCRRCVQY